MLTDSKSALKNITSVSDDISYGNLDELNARIEYYLDPINILRYNNIKMQLMHDVSVNCSPNVVARRILSYV
jgi:hypothetical protein